MNNETVFIGKFLDRLMPEHRDSERLFSTLLETVYDLSVTPKTCFIDIERGRGDKFVYCRGVVVVLDSQDEDFAPGVCEDLRKIQSCDGTMRFENVEVVVFTLDGNGLPQSIWENNR